MLKHRQRAEMLQIDEECDVVGGLGMLTDNGSRCCGLMKNAMFVGGLGMLTDNGSRLMKNAMLWAVLAC